MASCTCGRLSRHPATHLTYGPFDACVDDDLSKFVLALWRSGVSTSSSCQGDEDADGIRRAHLSVPLADLPGLMERIAPASATDDTVEIEDDPEAPDGLVYWDGALAAIFGDDASGSRPPTVGWHNVDWQPGDTITMSVSMSIPAPVLTVLEHRIAAWLGVRGEQPLG